MDKNESIAFLTNNGADNNLACPGSRYGRNTEECAPVAYRLAELVAGESGEPVDKDGLDYAMGLVVNDHDDVAYVLETYGSESELEAE